MSYLYSPSTGGFYRHDHCNPPQDAVRITAARHAELMAGQAKGNAIIPSPRTGRPILRMPKRDATTRRAALVRAIKRDAARRIDMISPAWRQLNDMRDGSEAGDARFARIDAVRAASGEIERLAAQALPSALEAFPVRDHPLWPSFEEPA